MIKRTFLAAAAALIAATVMSAPVEAAPAWKHLGTKQVNWLFDKDIFHVGVFRGRFKKIRLIVTGNKMFMHHLKIKYGNGDVQHVPVRFHFAQGTMTRVIDLAGNKRWIKRVTMVYSKPLNGQGRTWVTLFGRR